MIKAFSLSYYNTAGTTSYDFVLHDLGSEVKGQRSHDLSKMINGFACRKNDSLQLLTGFTISLVNHTFLRFCCQEFLLTGVYVGLLTETLLFCHSVCTVSCVLINPVPPFFLLTYTWSTSALRCRLPYIVVIFLVFLSIPSTSSFLQMTIPAEYRIKHTVHVLVALMILPPFSFEWSIRLTRLKYSNRILFFISSCLIWSASSTPIYLQTPSFAFWITYASGVVIPLLSFSLPRCILITAPI